MQKKITVADLVMLGGAAITFLFSFLDFFDGGPSAWSTDALAFATTVPALLALVLGVVIVLELLGVEMPAEVLTYNRNQLKAMWGISAAGIMLSWLTVSDLDKGIGFWLMFLGSLEMAVGGVMALLGKGTETVNIGGSGTTKSDTTTGTTTTGTATTGTTTTDTTAPSDTTTTGTTGPTATPPSARPDDDTPPPPPPPPI